MRKLFLAALLVLAPGCAAFDPAATVRQLVAEDKQGWCSAVVIAPNTALTAKHCVDSEKLLVDRKKVTAAVLASEGVDLATLTVPGLQCPCAEIGDTPAIGSKVKAIGFPGTRAGHKRVTEETTVKLIGPTSDILALPWLTNPAPFIYTEKSILIPGDSGGGLFQRQWFSWKLIGINSHNLAVDPFGLQKISSGFAPVYVE